VSVLWTTPLALVGVALIALPIAIHLLVRHQVRTLPYPSLRFLRETQLAAFRRHRIDDLALLICRCAIVAAAAMALAGPVLQTQFRSAQQGSRLSRAVVTVGAVPPAVSARLTEGVFASTTITRIALADGVRDALRWLDAQPRSAREVLIAGDLRRGQLVASDFAEVPSDIGIRFEQTASDLAGQRAVGILAMRNESLVRIDHAVEMTPDTTRVADGAASPVASDLVTIIASARDRALAEASVRAALDAGVPWRDFGRRALIAWDGADEAIVTARANSATVVRMPVPEPASTAADAVRAALARAGGIEWIEPIAITRAQLDAWSRPAGGPSSSAPVVDDGDRRWVWALALLLLALESWLRRPSVRAAANSPSEEVRVA